jgi:pilus assembly protein Flp/PilA
VDCSESDRTDRRRGASAVEYGVLVLGIAAVVVAAVYALGVVSGHQSSQACDTITGEISTSLAQGGTPQAPDCGH